MTSTPVSSRLDRLLRRYQADVTEPLYVDSVHYTRAMAGRLAGWIVDHLLEAGLVPRRN